MTKSSDLILFGQGALELRLPGLRAHEEYLQVAQRDSWSHAHFLAELLSVELRGALFTCSW
ncbi:hypothetical protein SAMN02745225_02394 [Ferrithrix thermotolerans DSM 19514]|uniref:Uncharacterized protein n=1 Tax=Ferrithrix thermotolerans DSM 19514 TaxID=1121881 RepID=A0A1M4YRB9_9ACTN|nr:hypothetical protein [Ferrithrix thermotolerans]SHF08233.1 hypothetical protein SAMN02745225_02394 [Ferrithrix thermotolerans DSM 19514]